MYEETFVEFETAKLLKEAGFPQDNLYLIDGPKTDDPLYVWYDNRGRTNLRPIDEDQVYWNAPTQAQAMRWLRECHHLSVRVNFIKAAYKNWFWDMLNTETEDYINGDYFYLTYEAAAEAGIQAACEYLIEKGGNV